MRIHRSRIEVLRILMYLDLHGVDATAKQYGTDRCTLERWQAKEPSGWEREEELNRLLMADAHVKGKVSYREAAVARGISWDKLWRIARRKEAEQRRQATTEAEQPDPVDARRQAAIDALSDERQRYVAEAISLTLRRRQAGEIPEPVQEPRDPKADQDDITAWVEEVGGWSEEEFTAGRKELDVAIAEYRQWIAGVARQEAEQREAHQAAERAAPEVSTLPGHAEPSPATQAPAHHSKPSLRVADDGPEWLWTPYARWRIE